MKYLRQENNRFIFEDGGEEEGLWKTPLDAWYQYLDIEIRVDFLINTCCVSKYKDIQTAVQIMTILKEEGLV